MKKSVYSSIRYSMYLHDWMSYISSRYANRKALNCLHSNISK